MDPISNTLAESVQVNVPWSRTVYRRCPDCVNLFFDSSIHDPLVSFSFFSIGERLSFPVSSAAAAAANGVGEYLSSLITK